MRETSKSNAEFPALAQPMFRPDSRMSDSRGLARLSNHEVTPTDLCARYNVRIIASQKMHDRTITRRFFLAPNDTLTHVERHAAPLQYDEALRQSLHLSKYPDRYFKTDARLISTEIVPAGKAVMK